MCARRRLMEPCRGGRRRNVPSVSGDASLAPSPFFGRPAHREILLLTVLHLLAVMPRVELHEAHVVLHGHSAKDGRPHPLAA